MPLMEQVQANTGEFSRKMSPDAGYCSREAVEELSARGVKVYM